MKLTTYKDGQAISVKCGSKSYIQRTLQKQMADHGLDMARRETMRGMVDKLERALGVTINLINEG